MSSSWWMLRSTCGDARGHREEIRSPGGGIGGERGVAPGGEPGALEPPGDLSRRKALPDMAHLLTTLIPLVRHHVDQEQAPADRKSTRLNSSHLVISYA